MGRPITRELANKIVHAFEVEGLSHRQVATRYGVTRAQSQSVVHRTRRGEQVGAAAQVPFSPEEIAQLRQMAAEHLSVEEMRNRTNRAMGALRKELHRLLGKPYAVPAHIVRERRIASLTGNPRGFQVPATRQNDHLKHCRAIMDADCAGSPKGFGFPVATTSPTYRVAA